MFFFWCLFVFYDGAHVCNADGAVGLRKFRFANQRGELLAAPRLAALEVLQAEGVGRPGGLRRWAVSSVASRFESAQAPAGACAAEILPVSEGRRGAVAMRHGLEQADVALEALREPARC